MSVAEIAQPNPFRVADDVARIIVNPQSYVGDRPVQQAFSALRETNPVAWVAAEGFDPFWLITKHADVRQISRQHDLFHSGDRALFLMDQASIAHMLAAGALFPIHNVINMDMPEHDKYRALTQAWFMPQQVANRADAIRRIARRTVEGMLARDGVCDFVEDVALRYPLRVIMEILGVPERDEELLLRFTQELLGGDDPDLGRDDGSQSLGEGFSNVVDDFKTYFRDVIAQRRREPRDDVASVIANSRVDGELIDEEAILGYYIAIATAGHDTTSSSTAGAIWELAARPAEFAKLKADPGLIPAMVDEAIRWTTPVQHFMRSATQDYDLRGRTIAKGDWVMLAYLSANQDEEVFDDPTAFRVDRKPNPHLAFGHGIHLCLGMHLARLEIRILFEELLPHLASLELAGEPRRSVSSFMAGPKTLPIRFRTV